MSSCSSEDQPRPFSAPTSFGPAGLFHSEVESDGEQTVMDIYQHRLEGARNPRGRKPKGAYLFGIDQRLPGMSVLKGAVKISWPTHVVTQPAPSAAPPQLSVVASRFGAGVLDAVASHRAHRLGSQSALASWAAATIQREIRRYLAVNEAQRYLVALSLRNWEMTARPSLPPLGDMDESQFRAECCREYEYKLQVEHYSTMILAGDEIEQLNKQCPEPISDAAAALAQEGDVGDVRLLLTGSSWFRKCTLSMDEIASVWAEVAALLKDQLPSEVEGFSTYLAPSYALDYRLLPSIPTGSIPVVVSAPRDVTAPLAIISAPRALVEASMRDDLYESQWRNADPIERRARRRANGEYSDEEADINDVMEDLGIEVEPPAVPASCTMGTETMQFDEDSPEELRDTEGVTSMVLGNRSRRAISECIICELDSVDVQPCEGCGASIHADCGVLVGAGLRCSRLCR